MVYNFPRMAIVSLKFCQTYATFQAKFKCPYENEQPAEYNSHNDAENQSAQSDDTIPPPCSTKMIGRIL